MAIVGDAYVLVHATTSGVENDIKKGFNGLGGTASSAGKTLGQKFSEGFNSSNSDNLFGALSDAISKAVPAAEDARASFHDMVRTAYTLGTAFAGAAGAISSVIGSIGAIGGAAAGAIASVAALGDALAGIGAGVGVAKLAFSGIGAAISKANKQAVSGSSGSKGSAGTPGTPGTPGVPAHVTAAQEKAYQQAVSNANDQVAASEKNLAQTIADNRDAIVKANNDVTTAQIALNAAIVQGQEDIKQLGFDAEGAALDEKQAGLDLEKARAALAAVQDLPPNNAARQAAQLAYEQADLAYRKAADQSQQLNTQQAQLAKTGVAGTQVVMDATSALADAQTAKSKAIVDALQSQAEAQQEVTKAQKDAANVKSTGPDVTAATKGTKGTKGSAGTAGSGGSGAGSDPFAGLNQAQKDFAEFILSLKPQFEQLKLIAANSFLPPLTQAIKELDTYAFPTVAKGVGTIGTALGQAALSAASAIASGDHLKDLNALISVFATVIEGAGKVVGSLFGIVLSIMTAAAPLTVKFTSYVVDLADKFNKFLDTAEKNGSLTDFFNTAGTIAGQFGTIAANIFKGIGAIIAANFGPGTGGDLMVKALISATGKFADLGDSANKSGLKQFFLDVAKNSISIGGAIASFVGEFLKLGANKNIGEAFDKLKDAAPAVGAIAKDFADAAPNLADIAVKVADIVKKLQDTGAIKVFFNTLSDIAGAVDSALGNKQYTEIALFTGRLAALLSAFGLVGKIVKGLVLPAIGTLGLGFKILGGGISGVSTTVKSISDVGTAFKLVKGGAGTASEAMDLLKDSANPVTKIIGNVGKAAQGIGSGIKTATNAVRDFGLGQKIAAAAQKVATAAQWAFNAAMDANPIALVVIAIAALVAGLIWFFTQTKLGKQVWADITSFISDTINSLVKFFNAVFPLIVTFITDQLTQIGDFFTTIFNGISLVITTIITFILAYITAQITAIQTVINVIVTAISVAWNATWNAVKTVISVVFAFIRAAVDSDINFVRSVISSVVAVIVALWNSNWNAVKNTISTVFNGIRSVVTAGINLVHSIISSVVGSIRSIWSGAWSAISSTFSGAWHGITSVIGGIGGVFSRAFGGIKGIISNAFAGVVGFVKGPINSIIGVVNSAINALNKFHVKIPNGIPGIGGQTFGLSIPNIPQLAAGATVSPRTGGTLVNVAEAGRPERVEPLDPDGLSTRDKAIMAQFAATNSKSNVTITVNAAPGQNEAEIAASVDRILSFKMRKGGL